MPKVTASSTAGTEALWAVTSDLPRWDRLLPTFTSVTQLTPGAIGPGSRFEVRQPGLARATYEVTSWEPGRAFTWVARSPGVTTTATHSVLAEGAGSRVELGLAWSGPLAPVIRLLLGRKAARMIELEAKTFARAAEGSAAA